MKTIKTLGVMLKAAVCRIRSAEMDPIERVALFIRMNDVVVIPLIWRNWVSRISHKLKNTEIGGWDSSFWNLARWYGGCQRMQASKTSMRPLLGANVVPPTTLAARARFLGRREEGRGYLSDDGSKRWWQATPARSAPAPNMEEPIMMRRGGMFTVFRYFGCAVLFLCFLISTASAQTSVQPLSGLVSWWPGDGNFQDIVDANPGTPQGDATFAPGKVGQGFSFDGDDDSVLVAHGDRNFQLIGRKVHIPSFEKPISRRQLAKSFGIASAMGALPLSGSLVSGETPIDSQLLAALEFRRRNSRDKNAVVNDKEMLVAFGDNLLHYEIDKGIGRLFSKSRVIISGTDTLKATAPLEDFGIGDVIESFVEIEGNIKGVAIVRSTAIHDVDFKVMDGEKELLSTFKITMEAGVVPNQPTFRMNTVYNVRTGIFPMGINIQELTPDITVKTGTIDGFTLLGIGAETVDEVFHGGIPLASNGVSPGKAAICAAAAAACFACFVTKSPSACWQCATLTGKCVGL